MSKQSQTIDIEAILTQDRPDIDDIYMLRREVYSDIGRRGKLEDMLAALNKKAAKTEDGATITQLGIGLWILNRNEEADDILKRARNRKGAAYFYAKNLLDLGRAKQAAEFLEGAISGEPGSFFLRILMVQARRRLGETETAMKLLEKLEGDHLDRGEFHYEKGYCLEMQGLYQEAIDEYEKASVLNPDSHEALFRMAYNYDLRGNDERAIETYGSLVKLNLAYASELINLGLLYEDNRRYEQAAECYQRVLQAIPNHPRALMYLDDARASMTMFYDEDKAKLIEKRNLTLNTLITDFELSVRSRNCLANMNIYSLGDLVHKTENDLLSYKNFGETSLIEVKEILRQKGLRLGMVRSDLEPNSPEFDKLWSGIGGDSKDILLKPLSQFELSVRGRRCLENMNIHTVGDLVEKSEAELLAAKNFGHTSLKELKELLANNDLELKK